MYGPELIARAISPIREFGAKGLRWQYNSRSDHHSKVACWAVTFDLLLHTPLLISHIKQGKVGFGLNHQMRNFQNNEPKDLDLVICRPHATEDPVLQQSDVLKHPIRTFADVAEHLQLPLSPTERGALCALPELAIVPVGMVHVALEAKAAMTEFGKAQSRLYSELDSSISIINGHVQHAIAAALVMVNVATEFRSTIINRNKSYDSPDIEVTTHRKQPKPAEGIIERVRKLKRRSDDRERGFDAIGVVVVEMRNDGSPCRVVTTAPPALQPSDQLHYDQMVTRASAVYAQRFASV
jgi:hypothetical protein